MAIEEGRLGRVEGILEEVRTRLNNLGIRLNSLEARIETRFYWLLGLMVLMWVTIILAIVLRT